MTTVSNVPAAADRGTLNDCWKRIGVRGDSSCPELEQHVHCRNCPVYSAAAVELLNAAPPAGYLSDWTHQVARLKHREEADTHSVVVFRIGLEWLALHSAVFREIANMRTIHSIPHRRNGMLLGLANIRGELLACVSLRQILGLEPADARKLERHRLLQERLIVMEHQGSRIACPVDEVLGIRRYHQRELSEPPATLAKAKGTYTTAVLPWREGSVGLLDEPLLFYTFNRSLALATSM